MSNLEAVADKIYQRWGKWSRPVLDREEIGQLVAISIGLGALFNESPEAEREWIGRPHPDLRCSPFHAIITGRMGEVAALVNRERGL